MKIDNPIVSEPTPNHTQTMLGSVKLADISDELYYGYDELDDKEEKDEVDEAVQSDLQSDKADVVYFKNPLL